MLCKRPQFSGFFGLRGFYVAGVHVKIEPSVYGGGKKKVADMAGALIVYRRVLFSKMMLGP